MFKRLCFCCFFLWVGAAQDPMQPLDYTQMTKGHKKINQNDQDPLSQIHLQGIILHGDKKVVIIDRETYLEGDRYEKFLIQRISLDAVAFQEIETKKIFLKTVGFPIKKTILDSR